MLYSFDVSPIFPADNHQEFFGVSHDHLPVGTIPLLAVSSSSAYAQAVGEFIKRANQAFSSFLSSEEGRGFFGQVCEREIVSPLQSPSCIFYANRIMIYFMLGRLF